MHEFVADLRHTIRSLKASPGLVAVSVLSLGLGLGVNLSLFGAIQAVFLYEPDVANRARVVSAQPGNSNQLSYLNYRDLRESDIFESVAGYRRVALTLRTDRAPEPASGIAVTPNFFEFLGVPMALGRQFGEAEAMPERNPRVVVLSQPFWRSRFNSDTGIVGRELTINGESFSIVGVLSQVRPVTMLQDPDIYVPISRLVLPTVADRGNGNALTVLGRLRPDTTRAQAQAALTALGQRLERDYPNDNRRMGQSATIRPTRGGDFAGSPEQVAIPAVLLTLFGLVLLSACANVAGLLLARSAGRQREIAVRVALGATRSHIVRLLLTESFSLAIVGLAAGAVLAFWLTRLLNAISIPDAGRISLAIGPSVSMGLYAMVLLVATGAVCGLAPALSVTRRNITTVMQGGESQGTTGRLRMRHAFVIGQVAICLTLLVLSSLMLRSLNHVSTMDTGFLVDRGIVATIRVDADRYADDGGLGLGEQIAERLQTVSGVESVSFANILALGGTDRSSTRLSVEGTAPTAVGPRTYINSVAPRYFATLGIPFESGRDFAPGERQGSPRVAIVTRSFERAYFQGRSALGQRVRRTDAEPYIEIVGVVRDHMYGSYGDSTTPIFYTSYLQQPRVSTQIRPVIMHIRTSAPSASLVRDVRAAIASVDAAVLADVRTLREATGTEATQRRIGTQLLSSIGTLGLLLATIGLYGLMAYVVATRTSEIGLRMALGATRAQIVASVLGQGMKLVAIGLAIGIAIAFLLAQAARGILAGMSPVDPIAFGGTAALLVVVGIAACYAPARKAAGVDPIVALRRL
ncbi:MAG TPA: ABC transporter permease [Vicinamibacterales bacterium]